MEPCVRAFPKDKDTKEVNEDTRKFLFDLIPEGRNK